MKLEKEVILDTYGLSALWFNDNFTQNEIKKLQQMHNKKIKLTLELEEPILDDAERKYLSGVIRPFKNKVKGIIKKESINYKNTEYINIYFGEQGVMSFPYFKKEKMYKNLELNKEYSLKDLDL